MGQPTNPAKITDSQVITITIGPFHTEDTGRAEVYCAKHLKTGSMHAKFLELTITIIGLSASCTRKIIHH